MWPTCRLVKCSYYNRSTKSSMSNAYAAQWFPLRTLSAFLCFLQPVNASCAPLSPCRERLHWTRGTTTINISRIPAREEDHVVVGHCQVGEVSWLFSLRLSAPENFSFSQKTHRRRKRKKKKKKLDAAAASGPADWLCDCILRPFGLFSFFLKSLRSHEPTVGRDLCFPRRILTLWVSKTTWGICVCREVQRWVGVCVEQKTACSAGSRVSCLGRGGGVSLNTPWQPFLFFLSKKNEQWTTQLKPWMSWSSQIQNVGQTALAT